MPEVTGVHEVHGCDRMPGDRDVLGCKPTMLCVRILSAYDAWQQATLEPFLEFTGTPSSCPALACLRSTTVVQAAVVTCVQGCPAHVVHRPFDSCPSVIKPRRPSVNRPKSLLELHLLLMALPTCYSQGHVPWCTACPARVLCGTCYSQTETGVTLLPPDPANTLQPDQAMVSSMLQPLSESTSLAAASNPKGSNVTLTSVNHTYPGAL
jgi:hypothetical protein